MARLLQRARAMTSTSNAVEWHDARRRRLFARHPEARALVGRNPGSAAIVAAMVALQLALAVGATGLDWPALALLAWCIGAVTAHGLSTFIHECAHDLVFHRAAANRALALLANVPLVIPGAIDFRNKHLAHHRHLGEPQGADTQAPPPSDLRFATSRLKRVVWHCFAPLYGTAQTAERDGWLLLNACVQGVTLVPFIWCFGLKALAFLVLSGWFAFGPHPVGVRRYGEHRVLEPWQPTASYYGPLNWVSFDVGHHVEHHDVPAVPWNRLRRLRALAPELYEPLKHLDSWSGLLWALFMRAEEGPARYVVSPARVRRGYPASVRASPILAEPEGQTGRGRDRSTPSACRPSQG
jgi:sphingolipid delta-4 desaturase